jgi:hypothetical protein
VLQTSQKIGSGDLAEGVISSKLTQHEQPAGFCRV